MYFNMRPRIERLRSCGTHLIRIHNLHFLRCQIQHTTSPSSIPLICLVIPLRDFLQHTLDRFRGTFDSSQGFTTTEGRDSRHALECGGELEPSTDAELGTMRCIRVCRGKCVSCKSRRMVRITQELNITIRHIPLVSFQSNASSVVFSIGSPTTVPSSSRTRACAAAKQRVVSLAVSFTSTSLRLSDVLEERSSITVARTTITITYSTPATPSRTRFSAVMVPVLSKQHTSTRPANGILNGSVQKIAATYQPSSKVDK